MPSKAKNVSFNNAYLWKLIQMTKEYYPLIIVYSIFINILTLAVPISVKSMVNTFSFGPYLKPLITLSLLLLGFLIVLGLIHSFQYVLTEYLQRRLHAKLTGNIVRAIVLRNEHKQRDINFLQLANRYFDVIQVQKITATMVTEGFSVSLQLVFGLILISIYHPLFLIFGLVVVGAIALLILIYGKPSLETALRESDLKYKVADFIESLTLSHATEENIQDKIRQADNWINLYLKARKKHFHLLFHQNIYLLACFAFFNALLLGLGGYLVITNQLTVGELVAAEIIVNAIFAHFVYARKYLEPFFDLYAAGEKLGEIVKIQQLTFEDMKGQATPVFKKLIENSENQFHQNLRSVRSIYYPKDYARIFRKFGVGLVITIILLSIVPWQQTTPGEGRVTALDPNDRSQQITAPVGGRIERWLVQDGQIVKKGDPIVEIVDNDPNFVDRLQAEREAAIKNFEAAKAASDTALLNFKRQKKLAAEGLSSEKEYEQAKISYKKNLAEEAKAAANLAAAEVKLSRQETQQVTAPQDGQILKVLHGSGSVFVKAGDPIADYVPSTQQLAVELWIDGNDLPLVYPGREVRLQFEGWPAIQFSGFPQVAIGSFGGIVKIVDPFVGENGMFRVVIVQDPKEMTKWPKQNLLRQGVRALGIILLEEVALGYEIWRQLNGFPNSMKHDSPELKQKKKES